MTRPRSSGGRLRALTIMVGRRPARFDPLATTDAPDEAFENRWRHGVKSRIRLVFVLLALWTVGIEARLICLQVVQHEYWFQRAEKQQHQVMTLSGKREQH